MTQQQHLQQQQLQQQQLQQQQQHTNSYVYAYVPASGAQPNQLAATSPSATQVQGNQYYLHSQGGVVYVPRQVIFKRFLEYSQYSSNLFHILMFQKFP